MNPWSAGFPVDGSEHLQWYKIYILTILLSTEKETPGHTGTKEYKQKKIASEIYDFKTG